MNKRVLKPILVSFLFLTTIFSAHGLESGEKIYEGVYSEEELNGEPWHDKKAVVKYENGFLDTKFKVRYHGNHDDSETLGLIGYTLGYGNGLTERMDEAGGVRHDKHAVHNFRPWNQPQDGFGDIFSTKIHITRFDVRSVDDVCMGGLCLVENGIIDSSEFESTLTQAEEDIRENVDANLELNENSGERYISGQLDFEDMGETAKFGLGYLYTPESIGKSIVDEAEVIRLQNRNKLDVDLQASKLVGKKTCLYSYGVQRDCITIPERNIELVNSDREAGDPVLIEPVNFDSFDGYEIQLLSRSNDSVLDSYGLEDEVEISPPVGKKLEIRLVDEAGEKWDSIEITDYNIDVKNDRPIGKDEEIEIEIQAPEIEQESPYDLYVTGEAKDPGKSIDVNSGETLSVKPNSEGILSLGLVTGNIERVNLASKRIEINGEVSNETDDNRWEVKWGEKLRGSLRPVNESVDHSKSGVVLPNGQKVDYQTSINNEEGDVGIKIKPVPNGNTVSIYRGESSENYTSPPENFVMHYCKANETQYKIFTPKRQDNTSETCNNDNSGNNSEEDPADNETEATNNESYLSEELREKWTGNEVELESGWSVIKFKDAVAVSEFNQCGENSVAYFSEEGNLDLDHLDSGSISSRSYFLYIENNCQINAEGGILEAQDSKSLNGFEILSVPTAISNTEFEDCGENSILYSPNDKGNLETQGLNKEENIQPGRYFAYTENQCTVDLN